MFCSWTKREKTLSPPCFFLQLFFVSGGNKTLSTTEELKVRVQPAPVVGDDVYIHLVDALGILGQVADGFAVRLLMAVDPVEPNLLLLYLLLQQRGLQGVLCVRD